MPLLIIKEMEKVKILGTGNVIEKGKLMEADKATAEVLVKQGKASLTPIEKTKEKGGVKPTAEPVKPTKPSTPVNNKTNGKGK